jgi:hypothetical protein
MRLLQLRLGLGVLEAVGMVDDMLEAQALNKFKPPLELPTQAVAVAVGGQ